MKKLLLSFLLFTMSYGAFAAGAVTQNGWRWRNDDGNEATATWMAGQNVQPVLKTCETQSTLRLRMTFSIASTGNGVDPDPKSIANSLSYATSTSGPWTQITTSSSNDFMYATSTLVSNGTATTQQLTHASGNPYRNGQIIDATHSGNISFGTFEMEHEWVIVPTANVAAKTYYFRQDGLDTYSEYPSIKFVGPTTSTLTKSACDSYTLNSTTYTSSNTYTQTLTNSVGCDSTITLHLTIQSNTGTDVKTACNSFTWIDGVTYTSSNNTATHTLTNHAGCDSVVTLNLTINKVDAGVSGTTTLTADAAGATYQWVNCDDNYSHISLETNQSFTPVMSGNYAVIVTENNCSDTSSCFMVTITGIHTPDAQNSLKVYPNPSEGKIELSFNSAAAQSADISILNTSGLVVASYKQVLNAGDNSMSFDLQQYAKGVYYIKITTADNSAVQKVVLK